MEQVLMLDVNGDLYPDFFGTDANGSRTYWINNKGEAFSAQSQGEVPPNHISFSILFAFMQI